MLVLSRRKGQTIRIGDDIEIVVTECHRSSCKIAIRAPEGVFVRRGELDVVEESEPAAPSRRPYGVMQPAGEASPARTGVAPGTDRGEPSSLPAGDTGTVSPPRSSVSPDPKGGAVLGEEGGSHPGLERALDLFDALVSARKRGK